MAEILGVVAGIVGVADAGFKIFQALSSLSKTFGSAGDDILLFSSEVRIFAEILVFVRANLQDRTLEASQSNILDKAVGVIPGLIMQCELVYSRMNTILRSLEPYKDSKFRVASKVKWVQEKLKMVELRGFLEPLKSSLQLLLSLIKNEIADNKYEPEIVRQILREELRAALQKSKSQPEVLDDELASTVPNNDDNRSIVQVDRSLAIRAYPLRTIKAAAEAMLIERNSQDYANRGNRAFNDRATNPREKSDRYPLQIASTAAECMRQYNNQGDNLSIYSRYASDGGGTTRSTANSQGWQNGTPPQEEFDVGNRYHNSAKGLPMSSSEYTNLHSSQEMQIVAEDSDPGVNWNSDFYTDMTRLKHWSLDSCAHKRPKIVILPYDPDTDINPNNRLKDWSSDFYADISPQTRAPPAQIRELPPVHRGDDHHEAHNQHSRTNLTPFFWMVAMMRTKFPVSNSTFCEIASRVR